MTEATPSGSVTLQVMTTWLVELGCAGECFTWRIFGGALLAHTMFVAPGVGGEPLAQELPRSLSSDGLINCIEGPPPLASTGHGNSDLKFTSSMTLSSASRSETSSPSLLRPPLHGPKAAAPYWL